MVHPGFPICKVSSKNPRSVLASTRLAGGLFARCLALCSGCSTGRFWVVPGDFAMELLGTIAGTGGANKCGVWGRVFPGNAGTFCLRIYFTLDSLCPRSRVTLAVGIGVRREILTPSRQGAKVQALKACPSAWAGGARATRPYRPATRRTERVRRSFCRRLGVKKYSAGCGQVLVRSLKI